MAKRRRVEEIPFSQIVSELEANEGKVLSILDAHKGSLTRLELIERVLKWMVTNLPWEKQERMLLMFGPVLAEVQARQKRGNVLTAWLDTEMPIVTFDRSIHLLAMFGNQKTRKPYPIYVVIDTGAVDNVLSRGFVSAIGADEWIDVSKRTEVMGVTSTTESAGVIHDLGFRMIDQDSGEKRMFRANFMVVDSPDPEMILIGQTFLRSYGSIIEQDMHRTNVRFTVSFNKKADNPFSGAACHPICVNDRQQMHTMRQQRAIEQTIAESKT